MQPCVYNGPLFQKVQITYFSILIPSEMFKYILNLHDQNITDKTFNLMVNLYCSWCKCTFGKLFSVVSCGSLLSPSKQPFGF